MVSLPARVNRSRKKERTLKAMLHRRGKAKKSEEGKGASQEERDGRRTGRRRGRRRRGGR